MNIQQYYHFAAMSYLNGSIVALVPVIVLIIPLSIFLPGKEVVWTSIPFFLYSISSYHTYLLHQEHSLGMEEITQLNEKKVRLYDSDRYLLAFMPAPSLRMVLFTPEGIAVGELRDVHSAKIRWFLPYFIDKWIPAEYGLYNEENQMVLKFKWRKGSATVYDVNGNVSITMVEQKGNHYDANLPHDSFYIEVDSERLFTDIQFKNNNNEMIGRVRKGWMPLEWSHLFKDVNTPVLTFDKALVEEERLVLLAILIKMYRYRNH